MAALTVGSMIGIIGGGQLGRLLAMAAGRLGYKTTILDPDGECPAAQMASRQIVAPYDERLALASLCQEADVITYEFENIAVEPLSELTSVPVLPPPSVLTISQDRYNEKQYLNAHNIATAQWFPIKDGDELRRSLDRLGGCGILKTRRFGYDGKGQIRVNQSDPTSLRRADELMSTAPTILEAVVEFQREISLIAARGIDGETAYFGIAENVHENGILRRSAVPAAITAATVDRAQAIACQLLQELNYVGVLAVEFFVLADGTLLVNEIAPRVHNSGHWTEAACIISQFEQHIRAVTGLPLGGTNRHSNCIMENIIGDDMAKLPDWLKERDCLIHLYGKKEIRAGRKMGHITYLKTLL